MKLDLRANREAMFPQIKDWTADHNEMRHCTNVRDQPFNQWYWFHTQSYKLQKLGVPILLGSFFAFWGVFLYYKSFTLHLFICVPMVVLNIYELYKTIKNWSYIKNRNFYDDLMRDI